MRSACNKIETLIEEAFHPSFAEIPRENGKIPMIFKTPENAKDLADPEGRAQQLNELLKRENPDVQHMRDTINTKAFSLISQAEPYVGKPMAEKDRNLVTNANALFYLNKLANDKQVGQVYQKLSSNNNWVDYKLPKK
jgi:hypothetical protein